MLSNKLHREALVRAIDPDTAGLTSYCLNPGGGVVLGSRKSNTIGGTSIIDIVCWVGFLKNGIMVNTYNDSGGRYHGDFIHN